MAEKEKKEEKHKEETNKQKKKKLFLFLTLSLIVIILIILFLSYQPQTTGKVVKTSSCEKSSDRDNCLNELAKNENDVEICNLIKDEKILYTCIVDIAKKNKDLRYCTSLKGGNFGKCLYDVAATL